MEIVDRTDQNYFQSWRLIGRSGPGAVYEEGGVLAVASGIPVTWFNLLLVTRPLANPPEQLRKAIEFFDQRGIQFVARIREGLDIASETALEKLGLAYSDIVPGMASTAMDAPAPPPELRIETVSKGRTHNDYLDVISRGFGFPLEMARAIVGPLALLDPEMESFVGYVGEAAVATSSMVFGGQVAGVYNVATHPDYRRRGYGEALTWRAVSRGAELGCDMAALQASDMGRPIYERMGFRLVSPYKTFHRPRV
ncbi:MAG: GNAT family N-acetyltransferase [Dehalococcoidia bacterium]